MDQFTNRHLPALGDTKHLYTLLKQFLSENWSVQSMSYMQICQFPLTSTINSPYTKCRKHFEKLNSVPL